MVRQQASRLVSQLCNALPELPSRQLQWNEPALPAKALESILPYTAPISRWRGRHLSERLCLRLPRQPPAESALVDGKEFKVSAAAMMQLRYPMSAPSHHSQTIHQQYLRPLSSSRHPAAAAAHTELRMYQKHLFLEDLDTFAADVAWRHAGGPNTALVTAHLDSLVWYQHKFPVHIHSRLATQQQQPAAHARPDIFMTGQVTWVGNSTLEVTLEMCQGDPSELAATAKSSQGSLAMHQQNTVALIARARFIMAAREPCMRRAARVPRLVCVNQHEKHLAIDGHARNEARHARRKHGHGPALINQAEHMLSSLRTSLPRPDPRSPAAGTTAPLVWERHFITSAQDVNTTGTVFGGQLLRYGMEAGEAAAAQYLGVACELVAMRDVPFKSLVHLGDHMHVAARVLASHDQLVAVYVKACRLASPHTDPTSGQHHMNSSITSSQADRGSEALLHQSGAEVVTNEYWCVYEAPPKVHVPPVLPPDAADRDQLLMWAHAYAMCKDLT